MRIISGNLKGKKIFSPTNSSIRPTSDKAREMIFNILASIFEKDDVRSNKLADLGYRLSKFGDTWSIRAKDLTEEQLQLVDYAQKEINAPKNRKKLQELKQRAKEKLEKAFTDE